MQYATIILAALAGSVVAQVTDAPTTTPFICNAAAIARGDCTATAASVPTTFPFLCNAAAIARGACNATAAVVPSASSYPFLCNAAALARGACTYTPPTGADQTTVVSVLVTYCPAPTTLTVNSKTYTVTAATTLTITDCPCTVVGPITSTSPFICNAAAIARGDCTATAASVPSATTSVTEFTGAADSIKPAMALGMLGGLAVALL